MGKQYGNPKYGKPVTVRNGGGSGLITFVMGLAMLAVTSYAMYAICVMVRAAF